MTTITAQKRDMKVKSKKLRREGFVPGVICGREIKQPFTIQMEEKDAQKLIRENQKGEKVQILVDGKTIQAIIKDFSYNAIKKELEVLDFQELVKGEKIHTSVEVILKNEMLAGGVVTQEVSEIHYKADSDHLIDTIILDFEKMQGVKSMKIGDLEAFKDSNVFVSNPDTVIFSVSQPKGDEEDEESEDAEA